jgi:CBS domain-containing protein
MKDVAVRELMVPLKAYATVSDEATLLEAVRALEQAQTGFNKGRYRHRAILVLDKNDKVVGKLSMMDIIKAVEPDDTKSLHGARLSRFGINGGYIDELIERYDFWNQPLDALCKVAGKRKVTGIMYTPTKGEYVPADASMQEAIHRLVLGHHHSLLVTEGEEIVGVLRLTDMFDSICQSMRMVFGD